MSDTHPVQGAVDDARGDVEIRVEIEVHEPQALVAVAEGGRRAQLDRAVASEHEHRIAPLGRSGHARGHLPCPLRDRRQVRRARARRIRCPPERLHVAGVRDPDTARAERVQQTGVPQRSRPVLLPRRIGAGAGRSSHDGQRLLERHG